MPFQFTLHAVLKARQRERDVEEQSTARARANLQEIVARRAQLDADRSSVMHELRALNEADSWSADQVVRRQRYLELLGREAKTVEAAIVEAQSQLDECLDRLLVANRAVQALEKLLERQLLEFQLREATAVAHEFCEQMTRQTASVDF